MIEHFYKEYDFQYISLVLWDNLTPLLTALPTSITTTSHTPALLKLIYSIAQHNETISIILCNRFVIEQIINCIQMRCDFSINKIIIDIMIILIDHEDGNYILPYLEVYYYI